MEVYNNYRELLAKGNIYEDTEEDSVIISDLKFDELVLLSLIENTNEFIQVTFRNCDFTDVVIDKHVLFELIFFNNCQIDSLDLQSSDYTVMIEECEIENISATSLSTFGLNIYSGRIGELSIGAPIKKLFIGGGSFRKIIISDFFNFDENKNPTSFNVNISSINNKDEEKIRIERLDLFSKNIEKLNIDNVDINELNINSKISFNAFYLFKKLLVDNFNIVELNNLGTFQLEAIKPFGEKSIVKIDNTDFNNTILRNCNFNEFNKIIITNSNLSNLKLYSTYFPLNISGDYEELYEVYNDLYSSALKRNNTKDKVDYYRSTQENLLKSRVKSGWHKRIPSIISLSTSKFYSNFGTDWIRAFLWIIVFSIVSFSSMMLLTKYDFGFGLKEWNTFKDLTAYFIQFLNPTHKITFMDQYILNISKSTWFVLFDFVGRILISIGIFEMIRSFRKYVRK